MFTSVRLFDTLPIIAADCPVFRGDAMGDVSQVSLSHPVNPVRVTLGIRSRPGNTHVVKITFENPAPECPDEWSNGNRAPE